MIERNGLFIVLDGIDGSGKTDQSKALKDELHSHGFNVLHTAEPTNRIIGRFVQEILFKEKLLPHVEALLFAADRYEHLQNEIIPNLKESNNVVICDRYLYSSLAYQGAQGVDANWIKEINNFALIPDIAFYLDVPPEVGLNRIKRKRTVLEERDLQIKVREKYLELVKDGMLTLVNSNRPFEQVKDDLVRLTLQILHEH